MQLAAGRPEAAAVIWNPLGGDPPEERVQLARAARRRGRLQALVAAAAAALSYWLWSPVVASVVISVAAILLIASQASPLAAWAAIERAFAALGHYTGEAITLVTMTLLFYTVFLPFGLLFRRGARDPMKRFCDPERDSYWERRNTARTGSDSRSRQY